MKPVQTTLLVTWLFIAMACNKKSDSSTPPASGPYFPKVKTIVQNNCLSCHSSAGSWAGRPMAFDSDSSIAAQHLAIKSAVADPVTPVNKRMPEGGTLSSTDINTIVNWSAAGGKTSD